MADGGEQREAVLVGSEPQWSAPLILGIVLLFHLLVHSIELLIRKEQIRPEEIKILKEIKQLQRQADVLSTPSTFAKAAKLRRILATKEKELNDYRQLSSESKIGGLLLKMILPMLLKATLYLSLLWWFWRTPVSHVPASLLQPFEWVFSMSKSKEASGTVCEIQILPWLVLCANITNFVSTHLQNGNSATKKRGSSNISNLLSQVLTK